MSVSGSVKVSSMKVAASPVAPAAPKISGLDFIKQVIDNISDQIVLLDCEIGLVASIGNDSEVRLTGTYDVFVLFFIC